MSRSNNHHCTPDTFGEQKGEKSPFFHIMKKEELQRILFDSSDDLSFVSEKDVEDFRIFFHTERRDLFLAHAKKALAERQETAREIEAHVNRLSSCLFELSQDLSAPLEDTESLVKHCANLTVFTKTKKEEISNNILISLANIISKQENERIFLQMQKELLFTEIAEKALGTLPSDWDITKATLSSLPPQTLVAQAASVLNVYEEVEHFLSAVLTDAAKAAKRKDAAGYRNLLHSAAVFLFDTATRLKSAKKGE